MMKRVAIVTCVFLVASLIGMASISTSAPPEGLVPLMRFYDHNRNVHAYAIDEREVGAWRMAQNVSDHGSIGLASPTEIKGSFRLWRAVRKDGKHYYYLTAPKGLPAIVDNDNFKAYVWKQPGDGRVPIYGNTWTDGTDIFFDPEQKNLKKHAEDTKKALSVDRKPFATGPAFYVYPDPENAKKTEEPAKK